MESVITWHLSCSTSFTYLIPSTLPFFLIYFLISSSPTSFSHLFIFLNNYFFLIPTIFTKHCSSTSFTSIFSFLFHPPSLVYLYLPFILQLQSVTVSQEVNRSSVKTNLNFVLSTPERVYDKDGREGLYFYLNSLFFFQSVPGISPFPFFLINLLPWCLVM